MTRYSFVSAYRSSDSMIRRCSFTEPSKGDGDGLLAEQMRMDFESRMQSIRSLAHGAYIRRGPRRDAPAPRLKRLAIQKTSL